jgi:hypothetical protein
MHPSAPSSYLLSQAAKRNKKKEDKTYMQFWVRIKPESPRVTAKLADPPTPWVEFSLICALRQVLNFFAPFSGRNFG